jgi:hypothetical protein
VPRPGAGTAENVHVSYHNADEDRHAALEESKTSEGWTVASSPPQCAARLRTYLDAASATSRRG